MDPFFRLEAVAAPLRMANIDTDKIIAGRFLKTISREGLGEALFHSMRKHDGFILNRVPWNRAGILIAGENFGCGSSREHAPWALLDFGIKCVIASSIADIFYNNCFKNGILPIKLDTHKVEALMELASHPATATMTIDLASQTITTSNGTRCHFAVDAKRRNDLLNGVDDIANSLGHAQAITDWERRRSEAEPWLGGIDRRRLSAVCGEEKL